MAELVDACDSKSHLFGGEGSSPSSGTMKKIITVVGQTSTGKSDLAVELAKIFNGEVVSCDSRQVYKKLNFGSGKISKKEMCGIKHHMLDVASLPDDFSVDDFAKMSLKKIDEILSKGKIPILCGGTGFYVDAILYEGTYAKVPKDKNFRDNLEKKDIKNLVSILNKLDAARAKSIDTKNKRRLIRAIEIANYLGSVPKNEKKKRFDFVCIGLFENQKTLREKIQKRLEKRWKNIKKEVLSILKHKEYSQKLMSLGLEYKFTTEMFVLDKDEQQVKEKLFSEICKYAKRQMTYFKKMYGIEWFDVSECSKKALIKKIKDHIRKNI